jgi:hypothetical protein
MRAARRRRHFVAPPERLPASPLVPAFETDTPLVPDYDTLREPTLSWEAD